VVEGEWEDGLPTGWIVASGGEKRRRRWEHGQLVLELEREENLLSSSMEGGVRAGFHDNVKQIDA
jgi:hypothetical protein